MKNRAAGFITGIILILLFWSALSRFRPGIIPPPLPVLLLCVRMFPGTLAPHAGATLLRALAAILLTSATAVPLGIAAARVPILDRVLSPVSYLLYPVPKVALLPVVMLIFGLGNSAKVVLLVLVLFFQMFLAVRDAVHAIPADFFTTIEVLGGGRAARLRFVIIPAGLPRYFTALRVGTGTSLAALFFSETFAARFGLGFFIMDSWMRVNYEEMFAGILAMGLVGAAMFLLIDLAERLLVPWAREGKN